jgi:hypothetical protein
MKFSDWDTLIKYGDWLTHFAIPFLERTFPTSLGFLLLAFALGFTLLSKSFAEEHLDLLY